MPGKGKPPWAILFPISYTSKYKWHAPSVRHKNMSYIQTHNLHMYLNKLIIIRRKHIVHLTGFGAYSSTQLFWMDHIYRHRESSYCSQCRDFDWLSWCHTDHHVFIIIKSAKYTFSVSEMVCFESCDWYWFNKHDLSNMTCQESTCVFPYKQCIQNWPKNHNF